MLINSVYLDQSDTFLSLSLEKQKRIRDDLLKLLNKSVKQYSKVNLKNDKPIQVGFHFVSSKKMKSLNNETRKINKTTDILSFPFLDNNENYFYLGDIFINLSLIKIKSLFTKASLEILVSTIAIHGLLHLLGYIHETNEEYEEMHKIELEILETVNKI